MLIKRDDLVVNVSRASHTGQTRTVYAGAADTVVDNWTMDTAATSTLMKGFDIDNYHARKDRGELLPMTPFYKSEHEYEAQVGKLRFTYAPSPPEPYALYQETDILHPGRIIPESVVQQVDLPDLSYFVQSAAAKISSAGVDMLTMLAELGRTTDMFVDVVNKIGKVRKRKLPGNPADLWLEGRYGWRPLAHDISDLSDALHKFDKTRTRYSERVGERFSQEIDNSFTSVIPDWLELHYHIFDTVEVSVRGSVVADISPARFKFDLLQTAWETVPYSFVADWLVNVGQALSALNFVLHAKDYTAAYGVKIDVSRSCSTSLTNLVNGNYSLTSPCTATSSMKYKGRTPCTVSTIPQIKLRMNTAKGLDLVALVKQRLNLRR